MYHIDLVKDYLLWLEKNIKSKDIKNGCHFTLPFLDNHNDHIEIYAIKNLHNNNEVVLTDGGYIINDLEMSGVSFNSLARKNILNQILINYGVKLDESDNSIYVKTDLQNLPKKKHCLVQCILAISDLYILAKESVQNFFFDDVYSKFKERKVLATPKITINGKSCYSHNIDILIPTELGDILIKTIRHPSKDRISTALFTYNDIRATNREVKDSLIIYDNREFEVKEDDKMAAKQYRTNFLSFTEVDSYIANLA